MVTNEHDAIVAVVPAAVQQRDGKRTFVSHPGSTYGGPVLREAYNTAARSVGILQAVDTYVAAHYEAAIFRPTVGLLEKEENQTLLYAFTYLGYTQFTESRTPGSRWRVNRQRIFWRRSGRISARMSARL